MSLWQVVELKTDAELSLKLQEDHHRITEAEIKKDLGQHAKNVRHRTEHALQALLITACV